MKPNYEANMSGHMVQKPTTRGMVGEKSNELRTGTVPKGTQVSFVVTYNHGAHKEHSKKHGQYKTWLKERNVQRYVDTAKHGQQIDGKNLLHCVRLIDTGRELAETRWLNVERPNAEYLLEIRKGKHDLDKLLAKAKTDLVEVEDAFRASGLPKNVKPSLIRELKTKIYL